MGESCCGLLRLGWVCSQYYRYQYLCQLDLRSRRPDDVLSEIHQSAPRPNSGSVNCGWAFVPWNILASAIAFLEFMSGYTVLAIPSETNGRSG